MPKYPLVSEYCALLEGVEPTVELDCGCIMREGDEDSVLSEAIVLYFCTLHDAAQDLLEALEAIMSANRTMGMYIAANAAIAKAKGGT